MTVTNNNTNGLYQLMLSPHQAETIQRACELYARCCIGQWQEAFQLVPTKTDLSHSNLHTDLRACSVVLSKYLVNDIDGNGSYLGIGHQLISEHGQTAWDIYQVTRHSLSWDRAVATGLVESRTAPRDFKTMLGVGYDEPMRYGKDPLPEIK
jgi:hypothetical protein